MNRPTIKESLNSLLARCLGASWYDIYHYSKRQDEYIDYLEERLKNIDAKPVLADSCPDSVHESLKEHVGKHKCPKCGKLL
jgi:hypothetical protein